MEAARLAGVKKFVAIGTICAYPKFMPHRCLDVSRAELEFGFRAKVPLRGRLAGDDRVV
jgi:hypothetical protein